MKPEQQPLAQILFSVLCEAQTTSNQLGKRLRLCNSPTRLVKWLIQIISFPYLNGLAKLSWNPPPPFVPPYPSLDLISFNNWWDTSFSSCVRKIWKERWVGGTIKTGAGGERSGFCFPGAVSKRRKRQISWSLDMDPELERSPFWPGLTQCHDAGLSTVPPTGPMKNSQKSWDHCNFGYFMHMRSMIHLESNIWLVAGSS